MKHVIRWKEWLLKFAEVRRRRLLGWWIVGLLVAAGLVSYGAYELGVGASQSTIATELNEERTERLEDGSVVKLEAGTTLRVRYTEERRDIRLLEGAATFVVAEDTLFRSFRVITHFAEITAVATTFAVTLDSVGVTIVVDEGIVDVTRRGKVGQGITLRGGEPPLRIEMEGPAAVTANAAGGLRVRATDFMISFLVGQPRSIHGWESWMAGNILGACASGSQQRIGVRSPFVGGRAIDAEWFEHASSGLRLQPRSSVSYASCEIRKRRRDFPVQENSVPTQGYWTVRAKGTGDRL
jgi:hypothetical protein